MIRDFIQMIATILLYTFMAVYVMVAMFIDWVIGSEEGEDYDD